MRCATTLGVLVLALATQAGAQDREVRNGHPSRATAAGVAPTHNVSNDERSLHIPLHARPALLQRLETVEHRIQDAPQSLAVLGDECPDGWEPRTAPNGELLYVPLGLLVNAAGEARAPYTLLVACTKLVSDTATNGDRK